MKQNGSFNDYLVSPISRIEIFFSFLLSSVFVCLVVAFLNLFALSFFTQFENINYILFAYYIILCAVIFSSIGALTGFLSFTWDVQSTVSNFFILPISFFSGTFFSINSIDEKLQFIFQYNPFYHLVKGFRNSFYSNIQINIYHELYILLIFFFIISLSILIFKK
jgi:ABC-2 type transport system permease protein